MSLVVLRKGTERRKRRRQSVLTALYDVSGIASLPNQKAAVHWQRQRMGPMMHVVSGEETIDDLDPRLESLVRMSVHQEASIDLEEWAPYFGEKTWYS